MATKYNRCILYPTLEEETCVCAAGSDVSGSDEIDWLCSEEYSKSCRWFKEYLENDERG